MTSGDVLGMAGLAVGLIGIGLSVYFYLKTRRIKSLAYVIREFELVHGSGSEIPGLTISYKGTPVSNLTAAKVLIMNVGTEVVEQSDIPSKAQLEIFVENGVVLAGRCISPVADARAVNFSPPQGVAQATVAFDYLSPEESITLAVLYSSSLPRALTFRGAIKGGLLQPRVAPDLRRWYIGLIAITLLMMLFALVPVLNISPFEELAKQRSFLYAWSAVDLVLTVAAIIYAFRFKRAVNHADIETPVRAIDFT